MKINSGEKTDLSNLSQQGGTTPQGFGNTNQGFGNTNQGFGNADQGFGNTQGFGNPQQGFSSPSLEKAPGLNGVVSLDKNEGVTLTKDSVGGSLLNHIKFGCGWDINKINPNENFDLDLSILQCDGQGQAITKDLYSLVFYKLLVSQDRALRHSGDNKTGMGDGDDEYIEALLKNINPQTQQLYVFVTINKGYQNNQNFGRVQNAYARIVDQTTQREIVRCDLNAKHPNATGIILGKLSRVGQDGWRYDNMEESIVPEPTGQNPHAGDLSFILRRYGIFA